jgi:uncharacterized membrane protein
MLLSLAPSQESRLRFAPQPHPRGPGPPFSNRCNLQESRVWRAKFSVLTEQAHAFVDQLAKALELVGVAIILGGIIWATVAFLCDGWRTSGWRSVYPRYRSDIGRGILLGLELLVGADIISTITAPLTFESVGLLAAIVAIRTFLSFSLEQSWCPV